MTVPTLLSYRRRLKRRLRPTYDELTLSALSYTCILFFATGASSLYKGGGLVPVSLMVAAGSLFLSIMHFRRGKKGAWRSK